MNFSVTCELCDELRLTWRDDSLGWVTFLDLSRKKFKRIRFESANRTLQISMEFSIRPKPSSPNFNPQSSTVPYKKFKTKLFSLIRKCKGESWKQKINSMQFRLDSDQRWRRVVINLKLKSDGIALIELSKHRHRSLWLILFFSFWISPLRFASLITFKSIFSPLELCARLDWVRREIRKHQNTFSPYSNWTRFSI